MDGIRKINCVESRAHRKGETRFSGGIFLSPFQRPFQKTTARYRVRGTGYRLITALLAIAFLVTSVQPAWAVSSAGSFTLRGMQMGQQAAGLEELGGRLRENNATLDARLMDPELLADLLGPAEELTTEARLMLLYADPDGLRAYLRTLALFPGHAQGEAGR